eukprot:scaffold7972_cov83-Phaeocystis_antarctica.AAC.1
MAPVKFEAPPAPAQASAPAQAAAPPAGAPTGTVTPPTTPVVAAATGTATKERDPPEIGAYSKRLCVETATEYQIGNKNNRECIAVIAAPPRTSNASGLHAMSAGEAPEACNHPPAAARSCIDLFAGAGGLAIGLGEAGFDHVALVEHDARKVATLMRNGLTQAVCDDVGTFDYSPWRGTVTLLAEGPPCQPFSGSGLLRGAADKRN